MVPSWSFSRWVLASWALRAASWTLAATVWRPLHALYLLSSCNRENSRDRLPHGVPMSGTTLNDRPRQARHEWRPVCCWEDVDAREIRGRHASNPGGGESRLGVKAPPARLEAWSLKHE
jgi:hypothetical protein